MSSGALYKEPPMIIARWHIDARFGHKQAVIDSLKTWSRDIRSASR